MQLGAEPWPDRRRVRVTLEITPFLEPPNIEVVITDPHQQEVSSVSIIQTIDSRMTFTMHLRGPEITGTCTLTATLSYPDAGTVHQDNITFEV